MPDSLPAVPEPGTVEGKIFGGEVVGAAAAGVPGPVAARVVLPPAARAVLRHGGYVLAGTVVIARRRHHKRNRHHRMMDAAEAAGNLELALQWAQHHEHAKHQRHERFTGKAATFVMLAKASLIIAAVWLFLMVLTGIALAVDHHDLRQFLWPWLAFLHAVVFGWELAGALAVAAMIAGPVVLAAVLYYHGRTGTDFAPAWAAASADPDSDMTIDERAITQALAALRIPQIRDYLAQGVPMPYIVPCRQEGRGTYAEIRLPLGLPASEIARPARRERLAAGLYRQVKEVWPSTGGDASHLRVWIADKGALEEGAGPYPLLKEGFTDAFKGLPFGRSLRGDLVKITVIGRNTLCGGAPEQGKSNGARVVAAGYALDIITEMRLYIPDTNFDFERFRPRCARYVMGAEDEHLERILADLEELKDELQSRGQLLVDMEQEEVTYALAHAGIGLHPVFVLIEEAHIVIQHRRLGRDFQGLLCDIVKLDRKRGVHLMLSTQAPTKDSMPRDVTRNCTNGIAYAVGDHVANDALLGQGAYRAGHRATELIPGTDRGTALCKGFSGEARSEMVQAHRISGRSGDDQVSPLVERSLAEMARRGLAVPGTPAPLLAIESRDLLDDCAEMMSGPDRVKLRDLAGMLRTLAPTWGRYRNLTAVQLEQDLAAEGVRVINTSGTKFLDPADLRRALAERG